MPRHRSILRVGGTLADEYLLGHEVLPAAGPAAWDSQRPPGPQARGQLAA